MTDWTRAHHTGTGPGAITPDGCSVEMYARLPENGESAVIAEAAGPGRTTLLELGAGAGRVTRPLAARGYRVTAVDESPEMLAKIDEAAPAGVSTVRAAIEDLRLEERFDIVTLASFLVNTADPALRARLLRTCARHVAEDGCVLIQRERDGLHEELTPGTEWVREGMTIRAAALDPVGEGVSRVRFEYAWEGAAWSQTFYSRPLPEPEFEQALADAGLAADAYLTGDRTWVRAVPAAGPAARPRAI